MIGDRVMEFAAACPACGADAEWEHTTDDVRRCLGQIRLLSGEYEDAPVSYIKQHYYRLTKCMCPDDTEWVPVAV